MNARTWSRRKVLAAGSLIVAGPRFAEAHNGTVHVTIEKLAFVPADIEVKAGETIEWTNKDPFAHTATVKGGWEVMIAPGKVAKRVAEADDTVEYFCRFHPNMKGRIIVVTS